MASNFFHNEKTSTLYNLNRYRTLQILCREDGTGRLVGSYGEDVEHREILFQFKNCEEAKEKIFSGLKHSQT